MYATQDFRLRMTPEAKQKLIFLAQRDGRSQAKMIERLILKECERLEKEALTKKRNPS